MNDLLMAWRNIWRNPRRSVLTILAIVFATALLVFMLSFQFGAYDDMIDSSVRLSTGHVQIVAPGYHERPEMRKVIETLIEKGIRDRVKVMVGGAPVNEKFAREIGADGYAQDAGDSVDLAKKLMQY